MEPPNEDQVSFFGITPAEYAECVINHTKVVKTLQPNTAELLTKGNDPIHPSYQTNPAPARRKTCLGRSSRSQRYRTRPTLPLLTNYHALRKDSYCTVCDEFGPYLFLLTCQRCCYNCLGESRSGVSKTPFAVMSTDLAKEVYGLTEASLHQLNLPVARTLQGNPSWHLGKYRSILLSTQELVKAAAVYSDGEERATKKFGQIISRAFSLLGSQTMNADLHNLEIGFIHPYNIFLCTPFLVSMTFPYLLPGPVTVSCSGSASSTTTCETGLWCLGCYESQSILMLEHEDAAFKRRVRRAYLRRDFLRQRRVIVRRD
ncbi:hypothetical protein AJ79_08667 [Helicocarpus griseus UAMH5409]|uniref:Uncharacterized protein n=1 Tax=Helicocarpus griseus UAMH5409 TaxID=1447875 RepID=A0A2B7WQZ5_9EURO|nr:hypothetical protein AJ79_08667 [Helicocarpus griseus UAMH5409]